MVVDVVQIGPLLFNFKSLWNFIMGFVLILVIAILGYLIGAIIGSFIKKAIEKTKLEHWIEKAVRSEALGGIEPPALIGSLVKWWIFALALFIAADSITQYIELEQVSVFLLGVSAWIPKLLVAVLIIMAGLVLADFAANGMSKAKKLVGIKPLSALVKVLIIIYFAIIALDIAGIKVALAETTFLIIISGIVLAFSLAIGISFGFAFKNQAEKILVNLQKKL